jgi:hypothetical protein
MSSVRAVLTAVTSVTRSRGLARSSWPQMNKELCPIMQNSLTASPARKPTTSQGTIAAQHTTSHPLTPTLANKMQKTSANKVRCPERMLPCTCKLYIRTVFRFQTNVVVDINYVAVHVATWCVATQDGRLSESPSTRHRSSTTSVPNPSFPPAAFYR